MSERGSAYADCGSVDFAPENATFRSLASDDLQQSENVEYWILIMTRSLLPLKHEAECLRATESLLKSRTPGSQMKPNRATWDGASPEVPAESG